MNTSKSTRKKKLGLLTMTGIFMSMIVVAILYILHIPIGNSQGYVHLGDAFIYLAAATLPTPYALVAAAFGGAAADILGGAAVWALPTALIKGVSVLFFDYRGKLFCKRNVLAIVLSGLVCVVGYYLAEVVLVGNFVSPIASIPMNVIQAVANGIAFVFVALALDKTGVVKRFKNSIN